MFSAANVLSVFRSLLRLFARNRVEGKRPSKTAAAAVMAVTTERREMMIAGFDMKAEIEKLADRIVEPVATKLTTQELAPIVSQISHAFEQLNTERATADTNFGNIAVTIMKPVQPMLSDAEFARVVDRLNGAMAGFCVRSDWAPS